jgi:hypothetical protein
MRPHGIVVASPALDDHVGLLERIEDLSGPLDLEILQLLHLVRLRPA